MYYTMYKEWYQSDIFHKYKIIQIYRKCYLKGIYCQLSVNSVLLLRVIDSLLPYHHIMKMKVFM